LAINKGFDINTIDITKIEASSVDIFNNLVPRGLRISQFVDKILSRELDEELLDLVLKYAEAKRIQLYHILNGLIYNPSQISPSFEELYVGTELIDLKDILKNKSSNTKVIQYLKNFHSEDLEEEYENLMESESDSEFETESESESERQSRKRKSRD
jgi:hypothetical protein